MSSLSPSILLLSLLFFIPTPVPAPAYWGGESAPSTSSTPVSPPSACLLPPPRAPPPAPPSSARPPDSPSSARGGARARRRRARAPEGGAGVSAMPASAGPRRRRARADLGGGLRMGELCAAGWRGADDVGRRAWAWTPNGAAERGCGPRTARPRGSPALVDPPQISRPPMPNLLAPRLPPPPPSSPPPTTRSGRAHRAGGCALGVEGGDSGWGRKERRRS